MIEGRLSKAHAARTYGVTAKIVARWVERFRAEGGGHGRPFVAAEAAEGDRPGGRRRIVALRRQRLTGKHIAMEVGVSPATVSRVLKRAGLSRLKDLEPAEPVRRYEREHPGEMIHIDIKKLGRFDRVGHRITGDRTGQSSRRGIGWEFVHVCIDDASRIAFSQILPDESKESAVAFLKAAVAYYASLGVAIARVMTDNGSCYRSKAFARACRELGLKHIRTKPYTPKTNGKAERFIQTALREWAYAIAYPTSDQRAEAARLAAPLQLAPATRQPKVQNTNQSPRPNRGQPVEAPQLLGEAQSRRSRHGRHKSAFGLEAAKYKPRSGPLTLKNLTASGRHRNSLHDPAQRPSLRSTARPRWPLIRLTLMCPVGHPPPPRTSAGPRTSPGDNRVWRRNCKKRTVMCRSHLCGIRTLERAHHAFAL